MRFLSNVLLVAGVGAILTAAPTAQAQGKFGTALKGQVVYGGAAPAQPKLDVTKDQGHCLSKGPVLSEELVINPANKGVKNVFVWITTDGGTKPPVSPALAAIKDKEVSIDQPVCAFVPHSLGMREGQTLVVKNSAPVAHNVNWTGSPAKNPGGNTIVAPGGKHVISNLKADKRVVSVICNIHGWMKGYIRVFDHPYFAVTDADGNFEIKSPPAGKYKIWYWSDTGFKGGQAGADGEPVEIKADVTDLGKVTWPEVKK
jgi:plastocyanin